jgi:hypothetical protein
LRIAASEFQGRFMKKRTNNKNDNQDIIRELCRAYAMELETVQNYIANSFIWTECVRKW